MSAIQIAIIASSGGCAACIGFLLGQAIQRARELRNAGSDEVVLTDTSSGIARSLLPLASKLGVGLRLLLAGGRKDSLYMRFHTDIGRRLSAAGNPQGFNPDEFIGFGVISALFGGFFGSFCYMLMLPKAIFSIWAYCGAGTVLGLVLWRSWLSHKQDQWRTEIRRSLPFSLDLLTLAMEAGLDFTSALRRMCHKIDDSPLGREYSLMLSEIQLGKTRSQALRDFARRVDVPDVGSVVASLIQAEELGTSLGPVLRIQSTQQRERRSTRAEEMAMKAPVKILFPLVFCLFPTVLMILFGPVVIDYFSK